MKQPVLGIVATAVILLISLIVVWTLGTELFMGWASYAIMGAIPFAIVVGAFWKSQQPAVVGRLPQPAKGLAYLVLAGIVAAVVAVIHWQLRGGAMNPPVPMAVMTIITSVVTTFFMVIAFAGWPFSLIKNKVLGGALLLLSAYLINAIIFQVFFNFGFAQGAPFYQSALDPSGLFNAWDVVVVMVTSLAVMFLFLCFDVWPITRVKAFRAQPVMGLVWTVGCFAIGLLVFWLGTEVAGISPPTFMVSVSIPFLFGAIVVLQMLGGSLFKGVKGPAKGLLNAVVAAIVGLVLAAGYRALMPALSGELPGGPAGGFAAELWLANSLLAVTFPLLAFFGDFFGLWPLSGKAQAVNEAQTEIDTELA